jgi:hypothetical protein
MEVVTLAPLLEVVTLAPLQRPPSTLHKGSTNIVGAS